MLLNYRTKLYLYNESTSSSVWLKLGTIHFGSQFKSHCKQQFQVKHEKDTKLKRQKEEEELARANGEYDEFDTCCYGIFFE